MRADGHKKGKRAGGRSRQKRGRSTAPAHGRRVSGGRGARPEEKVSGRGQGRPGERPRVRPHGRHGSEERIIAGWNPVLEALRAGNKVRRIFIASAQHQSVADVEALAQAAGIPVEIVDRSQLHHMAPTDEHQGIVAIAARFEFATVEKIMASAAERNEPPFLLVLDHVEDPQNLGSLIRTAECAGVHGVLIPNRRAAGITPAVSRASAGAIEHLPVAQIGNVVQEIERLKEQGIWVIGADMEGEQTLFQADMTGPIALVIGAEGKGLSRLAAERCDMLVRIPMQGHVNSLNASVAGALLMYEVMRARQRPGK